MMFVSSRSLTFSGVVFLSIATMIEGFSSIVTPSFMVEKSSFSPTSSWGLSTLSSSPSSSLSMMAGGFGGGGGMGAGSKKKKAAKKETKLKPKAQWDRYAALKKDSAVRVGVKIAGSSSDDDWLDVGRIKSKGNANTDIAVARQRAIIADHARRLYPLQVSPKDMVQWGYWKEDNDKITSSEDSDDADDNESTDDGEWIVVEKSVLTDAPKGIEKEIGFEGRPDRATGFYCHYSEGRLVAE